MKNTTSKRFHNGFFALIILMLLWGVSGLIFGTINVTTYWSIGLGAVVALLYITSEAIRIYGWIKGLLTILIVTLVTGGLLVLNALRSWPLGLVIYHDILGYKIFNVAWPIPIFWASIVSASLLLMRRKDISDDPKELFSWAFDSGIMVMILALVIEPLTNNTPMLIWVNQGIILGVPLTDILGWFVIAFLASVCAITGAKIWKPAKAKISPHLPFVMATFFVLVCILSTILHIALVQISSALVAVILFIWSIKIFKAGRPKIQTQSPSIVDVNPENTNITINEATINAVPDEQTVKLNNKALD